MELILDFQGFKDNNNQFVIKELALVSMDGRCMQHWLVRSPFQFNNLDPKYKRQSNWNTANYHGISWDHGDITIQDLHRHLAPMLDGSVVYVKGLEKCKYIQEFFGSCYVFDLEDYPSLRKLEDAGIYCFYHKNANFCCSLNNVLRLFKYYYK